MDEKAPRGLKLRTEDIFEDECVKLDKLENNTITLQLFFWKPNPDF